MTSTTGCAGKAPAAPVPAGRAGRHGVTDQDLPDVGGGTDHGNLTVRVGDSLFLWGPSARTLARIDLQTGKVETATAPSAAVGDDLFGGLAGLGRDFGRWLAPPAVAKSYLDPGIVASADGSRIYAIGVVGESDSTPGGSTGVFAFDASTLELLGHWQPTADFTSIGLSADGEFLYAARRVVSTPPGSRRGTARRSRSSTRPMAASGSSPATLAGPSCSSRTGPSARTSSAGRAGGVTHAPRGYAASTRR